MCQKHNILFAGVCNCYFCADVGLVCFQFVTVIVIMHDFILPAIHITFNRIKAGIKNLSNAPRFIGRNITNVNAVGNDLYCFGVLRVVGIRNKGNIENVREVFINAFVT